MNQTLQSALSYLAAGYSVIPVKTDGSKMPKLGSWKQYQEKPASETEIREWFDDDKPAGIGLVQGSVSGFSEVLDFDTPDALTEFESVCHRHEQKHIFQKLTLRVATPSGGAHLLYRCPDLADAGEAPKLHFPGGVKLAYVVEDTLTPPEGLSEPELIVWRDQRRKEGYKQSETGQWCKTKTKIETRAQGNMVIAPGSPAACHPSGLTYRHVGGAFDNVPMITPEERDILHALARTLTEFKEAVVPPKTRPASPRARTEGSNLHNDEDRKWPADAYNNAATNDTVRQLFEGIGCHSSKTHGQGYSLTRSGKQAGISVTIGLAAPGMVRVFSTTLAAYGFDTGKNYNPFQTYAIIKHGGDQKAATQSLGEQGYGDWIDEDTFRAELEKKRQAKAERDANKLASEEFVERVRQAARTKEERGQDARRAAQEFAETIVEEGAGEADLPVINISGVQESDVVMRAWDIVAAANDKRPSLFIGLRDEPLILSYDQEGSPYTQALTEQAMTATLRSSIRWERDKQVKEERFTVPAPMPGYVAQDMIHGHIKSVVLPYLKAVAGSPVVSASGELLTRHGYDKASRLYLDIPRIAPVSEVSDSPAEALDRIMAIFDDFPFASEGDKANATALMLTPFLRHYIKGPVPFFVVEAPTPGTGKTLLASALLSISTPGFTITDGPSERERGAAEEWSKLLGAVMADAPSVVLLDNLRGMIASGTLEGFLTNPDKLTLRILGQSKMRPIDASGVTLAATGNNALFQHDMARRCCFIRLDADMERPERRDGFLINNLLRHIRANRGEMLRDVVIILQSWIDQGCKDGSSNKGSFERWAKTLSGVLEVAGVENFLKSDENRAEASDPERELWSNFFTAWAEKYPDPESVSGEKTLRMTAKELTEREVIRSSFGGQSYPETVPGLAKECEIIGGKANSHSLGTRLKGMRGRYFGDWRLCCEEGRGRRVVYWLEKKSGESGESGERICNPNAGEKKQEDTNTPNNAYTEPLQNASPLSPLSPNSTLEEDDSPVWSIEV